MVFNYKVKKVIIIFKFCLKIKRYLFYSNFNNFIQLKHHFSKSKFFSRAHQKIDSRVRHTLNFFYKKKVYIFL